MTDAGICLIKPEFVLPEHTRELLIDCISERDKRKLTAEEKGREEVGKDPLEKRAKHSNQKLKGQNKRRKHTHYANRSNEICHSLFSALKSDVKVECRKANCEYLHDVAEYLKLKPADLGDTCYNFQTFGFCPRGITCRYAGNHIDEDGSNIRINEKMKLYDCMQTTRNVASLDLIFRLRKKQYDFTFVEKVVAYNDSLRPRNNGQDSENVAKPCGTVTDEDIIALLDREKRKISFKNKLYLSPLTTVGNLPFRRICKEYGADITCGEMAMARSILQGSIPEWALMKRHQTEDCFGVQICGNNPSMLAKCAQVLNNEVNVDFVDLNLGCPIELVYKEGGGCGLLRRNRILELCIRNLSQILTTPLTVKTRTGIYVNENIAHTLIPKFEAWGAALVTVHGRSREQRYTRHADWEYIQTCAEATNAIPVYGNGDIFSFEDFIRAKEIAKSVSGVMIGRGALMKPWIFTEIKEERTWDISSRERLEILQKFTNYGLEHWGSDTKGVENTRKFLLEWLSFLYRYVPVGLLERPPQKINERPPYYKGRDELETLMASSAASDWVKISEMLLGHVPENFHFIPKHKANSYK